MYLRDLSSFLIKIDQKVDHIKPPELPGARFQANTEGSAMYKVVCEMEVKYRFP